MSWKTLFIDSSSNIYLNNNRLVIQKEDERILVSIEDINSIIIDNYKINLSAQLINYIIGKNITLIICDNKHLPKTIIQNMQAHFIRSKKIKEQMKWDQISKEVIFTKIIKEKIKNQMEVIKKYNIESDKIKILNQYINQVENMDVSNREGLAAKLYFREIFGKEFIRNTKSTVNFGLDYAYSILLSLFVRQINAMGYITELGIKHISEFNIYNLASDLMEPFRPIVDIFVYEYSRFIFDSNTRFLISNLINLKIKINNQLTFLPKVIEIYCTSVFNAIKNGTLEDLYFPDISSIDEYEI